MRTKIGLDRRQTEVAGMRERRLLAGACGVALFALALRLGPLYWSPLPFNPDGVGYAGLARDALTLGEFPLDGMATDQVGYSALLSVVTALAGGQALTTAQPTSAFVGAAIVLVGVVLAARLAADAGVDPARVRAAGLLAGLLVSVEGVILYRSMPTDEQTAGLLLVPAVALVVDRWLRTAGRRWLALAALFLVVIPPLHNLTGLVTGVTVTVLAGVTVVRDPRRGAAVRAVGTALVTWVYVVGYHLVVAGTTGAVIVQADRLVRVPGLFVAWVVLAVVAGAWFVTTSSRVQRGAALVVLGVPFGLIAVNAVRTVFPSTTATPSGLLVLLLPLAIPAIAAGLAAHVPARSRTAGGVTVALVAAPVAIVCTGLTAALTFEYLSLVYRSHLFAHVPLLALAGVGAVTVFGAERERLTAVCVVVVLVAAAVSAPVAYAGLELRTYKSITTEAEFGATAYATATVDSWATDDHLGRVAGYHGGGGARGPVYDWLRGGGPPPNCPVLAQQSWTTTGAQFHPQRPATITEAAYRDWLYRNHVVYAVDASDPLVLVVPRGNATRC